MAFEPAEQAKIALRSSAALASLGACRCVGPSARARCESGDLPFCVGRGASAGVWPLLCTGLNPADPLPLLRLAQDSEFGPYFALGRDLATFAPGTVSIAGLPFLVS